MELSQLRSFVEVAREGSVTRGAEGVFLTQPAVTQQIRGLERELGVALFDRTGRGVRLTAAGEVLRDYAQRSLALLEEGRRAVSEVEAGAAGHLAIGAGVTTTVFHLPGWLREFQLGFPAVEVVVRTGRSREVEKWVGERELDLGIVTSPVENSELIARRLFEEEIALVTPAGHLFAGREMAAEELSRLPLILFPPGSGFRSYLDGELARAGIAPVVKMETDSVEAIKGFVAVGLGASFLPLSAVEGEIAGATLARVALPELPALRRSTSVIWRADRYRSGAMRGFLRVVSRES